jgi:hypothetical protein
VSLYASQLAKRNKLASVERVTASTSEAGNPPENRTDTDVGTRWTAKGLGALITYDLGSERTVSGIGIVFYRGTERVAFFRIATSVDGTTWDLALNGRSSGSTSNLQVFDVREVRAR